MAVDASESLLCWYVVDNRQLPWRAERGRNPDPYRVWLSEIMLQQTTVAHARPYFETFSARWPTLADLASADEGDLMAAWAGLGYYARARNLLACARKVHGELGGVFPDQEEALRKLPGIGAYTAAAIASIAFGRRAVAMDSNVERIVARLFAVAEPLPASRPKIRALADRLVPDDRAGDFTQAMMELGQTVCLPRKPDCGRCPLLEHCAGYQSGKPAAFPVRPVKKARPKRDGIAYWLEHDGHVLLERRPSSGLLGGMLGFPESEPATADWSEAGCVDHVFTHFSLRMRLLCAETGKRTDGLWWPVDQVAKAGLPTLFARLAERGREWRDAA